MDWLQTFDVKLFRFINGSLANPVADWVAPFAGGNAFFYPAVVLVAVLLVWKTRLRGAICIFMLLLIVPLGDGLICNSLKRTVQRPRPYAVLDDVRRPDAGPAAGQPAPPMASEPTPPPETGFRPSRASMPSSHTANWFAATMILLIYYRRSVLIMLPLALIVAFSRIYTGVHFPSDVLVGAILGAGYAAGTVWTLNALWLWAGRKWFPLWWRKLPSLLNPIGPVESEEEHLPPRPGQGTASDSPHVTLDEHWLRLGYVWIALCLLARIIYLAGDAIGLSGDEAYQWLWSKHLALSYYSKPPLIAYAQFLGTYLCGDTELGVRLLSPVIGAVLSFLLLRFLAGEANARAGFFLLLILTATPLVCAGAVLMTVDPLSVLFWTAAMLAGWRAVQDKGTTRQWLWVGLWMGLGFLSKYTALFQLLCWVVFFCLWPPARKHLGRPGPYLALGVNLLCTLPVLIWNAQHGWITVAHVAADNARLDKPWHPTLRFLLEFLGAEAGLLNPIFFVAMIWAAVAFWRRSRRDPRLVYLFSMGAPLFIVYLLYSLRSRILPNWIAPSVVPLFCLMVIYWDTRWRLGASRIRPWLIIGLCFGMAAVVIGHDTNLVKKISGRYLPVNLDPLTRVRGYDDAADIVNDARKALLAEGKPVFVIATGYGLVGQMSFYIPEARKAVSTEPLVFYPVKARPENQYYFWPGYLDRKGHNAIVVREVPRDATSLRPVPPEIVQQFESVTPLGVTNVLHRNRVLHPLQMFIARGLR